MDRGMKKIERMLYVTRYRDSDLEGLDHAIRIALAHDADLVVASLMPEVPTCLSQTEVAQLEEDLQSVESHRLGFVYSDLLKPAVKRGLRVDQMVLTGIPFIEVIHYVHHHNVGLVVLANEWTPISDSSQLGSTPMHLLRKCPCPVWVVQPGQPQIRSVVAAVDPFSSPRLHAEVLDHASRLAGLHDAELHVVHAWRLRGQELLRSPLCEVEPQQVEAWREKEKAHHVSAMENLLDEIPVARTWIDEGDAGGVVVDRVRSIGADLLVMGTVNRTDVTGFFIGHHSEYILGRVPCSIFAVKPEAFQSPVPVGGLA